MPDNVPLPSGGYPARGRGDVTLDNCDSVLVTLVTEPPQSTQLVVRRDRPPLIRPVPLKAIRQLRPGDLVRFERELRVVERVEPYR